ncbi:hypothetical protein S7711_03196 [Stachybotrys chartarum IBT 7711]|uniref:Uncharacterized protein n=1 Tax=Stachybotrys chartarum (strain CBS 109288 / IBT 7711) TaxID=1280523 RepID=A0A084AWN2_STACB|nr:hypothetical protein S7711_03196 [Stachybotrys chartarum IBT 7711]KFA49351.1 hypothetical protein S40293_04149 [Stachybotrys chartarum IBT 40293]
MSQYAKHLSVPAVAGVGLVGAAVYATTRPKKDPEDQRRDRVQAKRDSGLGGAGVGGNFTTGGFETGQVGSGTTSSTHDSDRKIDTDASRDQLPSGGVGGGVGGGGMNTRATEMTTKKQGGDYGDHTGSGSHKSSGQDSVSSGGSSSASSGKGPSSGSPGSSSQDSNAQPSGFSERFQGLFGQGGKSASDNSDIHAANHQTVAASNHAQTPTKKMGGEDSRLPR